MFRLLLAAGMLLTVAVPGVASQAPSVTPAVTLSSEVEDLGPEGRLNPETELAQIAVVLTIACEIPPSPEGMTITFSVGKQKPAYASIILNPLTVSLDQDPTDCADPDFRSVAETTALLTTTREAPAFTTFSSTVEATVKGAMEEYGPFATSFNLTNDFIPLTQVTPAYYFQKAPQGKVVRFPITVANLGNGAGEVSTSVSQPNANKLDEIVPPALMVLESRAQKGAAAVYKQDAWIDARAPSGELYTNTIYSFNADFTTRSTQGNDTATDSTTMVFSIQVQGTSAGAPGPSVVGLFMIAAAVAAVERSRRRAP